MNIQSIRKVNSANGWQWINYGVRYFIKSKLSWLMSLLIIVLCTMSLISLSPLFQIVLVFVFPFIAVGLSMACADIEDGKEMSINYLVKGFSHANRLNIFRYGFLIILMMLVAQVFSSIVVNAMGISNEQLANEFLQLKSKKNTSLEAIISSAILFKYFIVSIVVMLPVVVVNLFSPIILTFSNLTGLQAVKLSFLAGIKNLPALSVYGLIFLVLIVLVIFLLKLFILFLYFLFGEESIIAESMYMIIFLTCILTLASLSYCSAYVAFKDIFGEKT